MTEKGLTLAELQAERAIALPDKEVVSVIDVNADINLAINAASPIDLAAAANLNVVAPIQASAGANVLTYGSDATATAGHGDVGTVVNQYLGADATATSSQDSSIDQGATTGTTTGGTDTGGTTTGGTDTGGTTGTGTGGSTTGTATTGGVLDGSLLNVNVTVDLNTDLAAPIGGAVAVNANVAAPINAGVAANIGSINSHATALSVQDATLNQTLTGTATATQDQISQITQGGGTTTTGTAPAALSGSSTPSVGTSTGTAGAAATR